MRTEPTLAAISLPVGADGFRVPLTFRVEGGLHYFRGNAAPYFSLTYTRHRKGFPDQSYACGAGHDKIARYFGDRFADLAALQGATIDGVPMHAEANGWYQLAGALGGAGETHHAGNSYGIPTQAACLEAFARHCRITTDEAEAIRAECSAEHAHNPDGWKAARATMALRMDDMRARWKAEAEAAIARHNLRVYGDPWPPADALLESIAE